MNLKIGAIIKTLRQNKKITQEQLAAFIGVTPQAISRWEAGNGYPDIETLPLIADFFSVSTDCLLGVNRDEKESRRLAIYKRIQECKELGLGKDVLDEARLFAAEFPSDERIQKHLSDTICRGYMWDDEPNMKLLDESEMIDCVLIETTKNIDFRNEVLEGLAYLYAVGYKDKVKVENTVKKLPRMAYCRESVGAEAFIALNGDLSRKQDYIEKLTCTLASVLGSYIIDNIPNGSDMWDIKIGMFEKLIDLYHFVFGDQLLYYHSEVASLYRVIATYKVAQKKYDETLDCLEKMLYHVKEKENCKMDDKFDSPFMSKLTYYRELEPDERCDYVVHNDAWYVLNEKMTQTRYDPVREMSRFQAIVAELEKIAI